jgi:radical SAM-linked protein
LRVLLKLRKGEEVKYLSHLDMVRAFEFALRRSELPMAFSEGFNPRPKMAFCSAIGVGVLSDDERIMITLSQPLAPECVKDRLNGELPPGMEIAAAEEVPEGAKSPLATLAASEYSITVGGPSAGEAEEAALKLFEEPQVRVTRTRKDGLKEVDIRPHLLKLSKVESEGGYAVLTVCLASGSSGGARPQDFVEALKKSLPNLAVKKIKRLKQYSFSGQKSCIQPD